MNRQLLELARLYGIQTSYIDMTKQRHYADPEALLMVLRAMGTAVEKLEDVAGALAFRKDELRKRSVEPVMVAWDGKLKGMRFEFGYHDVEINGHETFVISAPKEAYFPLPEGEEGAPSARRVRARVANASQPALTRPFGPALSRRERAHFSGTWGLFVPIYSLHSRRSPNAGDLSDFEQVVDWMGDLGGSVAATLPLLAGFLDEPFDPSPYSPASRLFWNEFYIDITRIPEFAGNAEAKRLAEKRPRRTKFVDYRQVMVYKRRILEELSRSFFARPKAERIQAFRKFVREHRGVENYARFRAVTDRRRSGWNAWPARQREGNIRNGDYDESTKNYHLYSQWIVQGQLESLSQKAASRGQMLYLDLPLGLHPDGYDIWSNRQFFVRGVAGGAPPDLVFTTGQNWGFPPMHPEAMRLNRYRYVIAYIRNHLRYARLLRIDHVMGLHRLYWIPNELTGDKGVYVDYPAEELYAILSLESHRYHAGIVGENLGTVPPTVNSAMAQHNIRQMYVVQYEIFGDPKNPKLRRVPAKCVASLNTHDMPPFKAFLEGTDIDDRLDLGFLNPKGAREERKQRAVLRKILANVSPLPPGEGGAPSARQVTARTDNVLQPALTRRYYSSRSSAPPIVPALSRKGRASLLRGVLQFLADSMANIVLVNVEDLWKEGFPQNVPATNKERPNWRRRIRPSIEEMRRMAEVVELLSDVFAKRSRPLSL